MNTVTRALGRPGVMHGSGMILFKSSGFLYECWHENHKKSGLGRYISNVEHVFEGDYVNE